MKLEISIFLILKIFLSSNQLEKTNPIKLLHVSSEEMIYCSNNLNKSDIERDETFEDIELIVYSIFSDQNNSKESCDYTSKSFD